MGRPAGAADDPAPLDHNFRGSFGTPLARLGDRDWTRRHGISASVMDYVAVNLARPAGKPGEPGDFYDGTVGDYDRWAIAYGYTADPERARALARQGAEPRHAFGNEVDFRAAGAIDPSNEQFDLSDDPLAWAIGRNRLIRSLLPELPRLALRDDKSRVELTNAVLALLGGLEQTFGPAVRSIGGQLQNFDHVGDPGGRLPFTPVPRARQRQALAFLATEAFGEHALAVPPELLQQLGNTAWDHWGFENTFGGRIDFPYRERVLAIQREVLAGLTDPLRLAAIGDGEAKFGAARVLTLPELLEELTRTIWSEVWAAPGRNVSALRRDLQRAYLDRMIELLLKPPDRTPADARSLARLRLRDLGERIARRLAGHGFDAYTVAHLREARERIDKALGASYTLQGGS